MECAYCHTNFQFFRVARVCAQCEIVCCDCCSKLENIDYCIETPRTLCVNCTAPVPRAKTKKIVDARKNDRYLDSISSQIAAVGASVSDEHASAVVKLKTPVHIPQSVSHSSTTAKTRIKISPVSEPVYVHPNPFDAEMQLQRAQREVEEKNEQLLRAREIRKSMKTEKKLQKARKETREKAAAYALSLGLKPSDMSRCIKEIPLPSSKDIAKIIGPKGKNIQQLQKDHPNVKIILPSGASPLVSSSSSRAAKCVVHGLIEEDVERCSQAIMLLLSSSASKAGKKRIVYLDADQCMDLHEDMIQILEQRYHVKITLPPTEMGGVAEICGDGASLEKCVEEITDLLYDGTAITKTLPYPRQGEEEKMSECVEIPEKEFLALITHKNYILKSLENNLDKMKIRMDAEAENGGNFEIKGSEKHVKKCVSEIKRFVAASHHFSDPAQITREFVLEHKRASFSCEELMKSYGLTISLSTPLSGSILGPEHEVDRCFGDMMQFHSGRITTPCEPPCTPVTSTPEWADVWVDV